MTARLVQKDFFKGTQEFEIIDEAVNVRFRTLFSRKELSVVLTILNPDPVIEAPYLHFHSRVKCDPLLSLYLNKPNPAEFNAFVEELKRRVRAYNFFLGPDPAAAEGALSENGSEPPASATCGQDRQPRKRMTVNVESIERSIRMLEQYLGSEDIRPVVSALEALRSDPANEAHMVRLAEAFDGVGPRQGAVLTYAPYIGILLSGVTFGSS
jgi:hypothetical protein